MDPIAYHDTSKLFRRFWERVDRRSEKVYDTLWRAAGPIDTLEQDWNGMHQAWAELVSTEEGQREVVLAQRKPFGERRGDAADTLLSKAICTGHGWLIEQILALHDTFDPGATWAAREDNGHRGPLTRYPLTVNVLVAMARRSPELIARALDTLMEDIKGALEHGDPREIAPCSVAIDTWTRAASQSEDIILPAVHAWITQRAHPRVGHPGTDEALARLGSFTRSQELIQMVNGVRTSGQNKSKKATRKI